MTLACLGEGFLLGTIFGGIVVGVLTDYAHEDERAMHTPGKVLYTIGVLAMQAVMGLVLAWRLLTKAATKRWNRLRGRPGECANRDCGSTSFTKHSEYGRRDSWVCDECGELHATEEYTIDPKHFSKP